MGQEDKSGIQPVDYYILFYGYWNLNHHLGTAFFITRESYQQLRGQNLLVKECRT